MPGQWDDALKSLFRKYPQDVVSWLLQGAQFVSERSTELKNRTIDADLLFNVTLYGVEMILHLEIQRRRDSNMGKRLWEYNFLTTYTTGLPVSSFALYLKRDGNVVEPPYELKSPTKEKVHVFYYKNIEMWKLLASDIRQTGLLGLQPLALLTKDGARDEVVKEITEEFVAAKEKDLLAITEVLGGLAFPRGGVPAWFKRSFAMHDSIIEESWVYQEIKRKGLEQGLEQGLERGMERGMERGELDAQRRTLLELVEEYFPTLAPLAKRQANAIDSPNILRRAVIRLSAFHAPQEAEQYLLTLTGDEKKN